MSRQQPHEIALALIKEVGVGRLACFDGCVCSSFEIQNIKVEIACGKGGEKGIWVSSQSGDYWDDENHRYLLEVLRPIADEVKRQIDVLAHRGEFPAHVGDRQSSNRKLA